MSTSTLRRYPPELRERAVRMLAEIRGDHDSEWAAMRQVAELLGVGTPETIGLRDKAARHTPRSPVPHWRA